MDITWSKCHASEDGSCSTDSDSAIVAHTNEHGHVIDLGKHKKGIIVGGLRKRHKQRKKQQQHQLAKSLLEQEREKQQQAQQEREFMEQCERERIRRLRVFARFLVVGNWLRR